MISSIKRITSSLSKQTDTLQNPYLSLSKHINKTIQSSTTSSQVNTQSHKCEIQQNPYLTLVKPSLG